LSPKVLVPAVCVIGAFGLSVLLTFAVRGWARRWAFLDVPGAHKAHAQAVPLGGGVAMTWSFVLVVCAGLAGILLLKTETFSWLPSWLWLHKPGVAEKAPSALLVIGSALFLHAVGLIDDMRPLPVLVKLLAQVGAASLVVFGCQVRAAEFLGFWPSSALTILWLVGVCNSINLLDNTDGLCAGVVAIAASLLAISATQAGQIFVPALAWTLVGATLGFLLFNFPPATIFMGDAGSLPIGFLLAVLTVLVTYYDPQQAGRPYGLAAPLLILAVPLYDTVTVLYQRRKAGAPLLKGDRRHFSHRLLRRGMSPAAAILTIYLATATTGLSALLLPRATWPQAILLFVQCLCVLSIVAILEAAGAHGEPSE